MIRFVLFSKLTGAWVAQGQCADGTEPDFDADLFTRLFLGDGHHINANSCLVSGQVQQRQEWATPPVTPSQAAGNVTLTGLPANTFVSLDADNVSGFERVQSQTNGSGSVTFASLPAGKFTASLDGAWKGIVARITIT